MWQGPAGVKRALSHRFYHAGWNWRIEGLFSICLFHSTRQSPRPRVPPHPHCLEPPSLASPDSPSEVLPRLLFIRTVFQVDPDLALWIHTIWVLRPALMTSRAPENQRRRAEACKIPYLLSILHPPRTHRRHTPCHNFQLCTIPQPTICSPPPPAPVDA